MSTLAYLHVIHLGGQGEHADYCKATESIALTEVDAGFQEKRDLLTEHLRLVSGAGQCGARKFRWLKAATDCRPGYSSVEFRWTVHEMQQLFLYYILLNKEPPSAIVMALTRRHCLGWLRLSGRELRLCLLDCSLPRCVRCCVGARPQPMVTKSLM